MLQAGRPERRGPPWSPSSPPPPRPRRPRATPPSPQASLRPAMGPGLATDRARPGQPTCLQRRSVLLGPTASPWRIRALGGSREASRSTATIPLDLWNTALVDQGRSRPLRGFRPPRPTRRPGGSFELEVAAPTVYHLGLVLGGHDPSPPGRPWTTPRAITRASSRATASPSSPPPTSRMPRPSSARTAVPGTGAATDFILGLSRCGPTRASRMTPPSSGCSLDGRAGMSVSVGSRPMPRAWASPYSRSSSFRSSPSSYSGACTSAIRSRAPSAARRP